MYKTAKHHMETEIFRKQIMSHTATEVKVITPLDPLPESTRERRDGPGGE